MSTNSYSSSMAHIHIKDLIHIFCRNATKLFLQPLKNKCFIIYALLSKFFHVYSYIFGFVWRDVTQT